jgi:AraC family transcriptional regulator, transcriptional activator of pobA
MRYKIINIVSYKVINKTVTSLADERIVIEAECELYLTNKSIKEIAYELSHDDEHYFSRFFKNNADVSPQMYRDTVGFARGMN